MHYSDAAWWGGIRHYGSLPGTAEQKRTLLGFMHGDHTQEAPIGSEPSPALSYPHTYGTSTAIGAKCPVIFLNLGLKSDQTILKIFGARAFGAVVYVRRLFGALCGFSGGLACL